MTSAVHMSRTRAPQQNRVELVQSVVTQRVDAYANRLFASYRDYGHKAEVIITQYIQKLKMKCYEEFGKWSVAELQEYHQWQTSDIVIKINRAKAGCLDQVLSQNEMIELEEFRKSTLGQKKADIDLSLTPIVRDCHLTLEKQIISPLMH